MQIIPEPMKVNAKKQLPMIGKSARTIAIPLKINEHHTDDRKALKIIARPLKYPG